MNDKAKKKSGTDKKKPAEKKNKGLTRDLLEALKIVLVQLGEYHDGEGSDKYHAINIAKATISKAEAAGIGVPE